MIPEQLKTTIERDVRLLGDAYHILAGYVAGEVAGATHLGMTPERAKAVMESYREAREWMQDCQIRRRVEASQTIAQAKEIAA